MTGINQVPPARNPGAALPGRVRIISDGRAHGTRVLMPNGTRIPHVKAIEILPIRAGGKEVHARITLALVELDVVAESAGDVPAARDGPEVAESC